MNKLSISNLAVVPSAGSNDAAVKLRQILRQHRFFDEVGERQVTDLPDPEVIGLTSANSGIVACFAILSSGTVRETFPDYKALFEFLDNGTCIVTPRGGPPSGYDTWAKGYSRIVHDIYEYWAQRAIDAQVMADEYKLLIRQLPPL